jgi:hypothetical protein
LIENKINTKLSRNFFINVRIRIFAKLKEYLICFEKNKRKYDKEIIKKPQSFKIVALNIVLKIILCF